MQLGYLFGVFGAVWSLVIHDQYVVRIINMMAAFNPSLLDDDASSSEDSDNATATFQDLYETYVPGELKPSIKHRNTNQLIFPTLAFSSKGENNE